MYYFEVVYFKVQTEAITYRQVYIEHKKSIT